MDEHVVLGDNHFKCLHCGTEGFCDLCNMRPCACANRFWVGEQVNPEQIAEAVRSEQAKHAGHCPKRWAFVLDCSCGVGS